MTIKSWVRITPDAIVSDRPVPVAEGSGKDMLVSAFRALGCGYAKFHKMDTLSKAGFLASEILLSDELGRFEPREDRAVLLFNSSASLCDDRHYQNTINDPQNWFPSPAVFVYTLPNIVTGEIAIRNKYYGETCFYVMEKPDAGEICRIVGNAFQDRVTRSAVCGLAECSDDDAFEVVLFLVEKDGDASGVQWNTENISAAFGCRK